MDTPNITREILDKIFRDPDAAFGLQEFQDMDPVALLPILREDDDRYTVRCRKTSRPRVVYNAGKNHGQPEEIIRQLWLVKLTDYYGYPVDRIEVAYPVRYGHEVDTKGADIVILKSDKQTAYIIIETKQPKRKEGTEQLKSYMNALGAEIGVWTNGKERVIFYRQYPQEFNNTLPDLPRADQTVDDLLTEPKYLDSFTDTRKNMRHVIERMEELVLANSGADVFSETFKLIYAKLLDEDEAEHRRPKQEVLFRQYRDPQKTYDVINDLFRQAVERWPGTFFPQEKIGLSPNHLSVVVGELQVTRLFHSNLSIVDDAFEYLVTREARGEKGQYFTPRHVIQMAVRMLRPREKEYVLDPAAGSGGFLIHAMYDVWAHDLKGASETAKKGYARERLWGIDFDEKMAKISRAVMLIAGDGRSHLFKLNSLDPRDWRGEEKQQLDARSKLKERLRDLGNTRDNKENENSLRWFDFDCILTNPPFAGEINDSLLLRQYELGKNKSGEYQRKVERHILFIERCLQMLRPGGRMAIVLPQGVLNNSSMEYIREWLFGKARILAVVGLHGNTFKPHTGTKTSVLFLQTWKDGEEPLKDYPIFMAVSKHAGKDSGGDYVYKKRGGSPVLNPQGLPILDHDLDEIAAAFEEFAKKEKLNFIS